MLRRLYMVLKASPVKKGLGLVHSVESFIDRFVDHRLKDTKVEARIAELRHALHLAPKGPSPQADGTGRTPVAARSSTVGSGDAEGVSANGSRVDPAVASVRSDAASTPSEEPSVGSETASVSEATSARPEEPSVVSEIASVRTEAASVASVVPSASTEVAPVNPVVAAEDASARVVVSPKRKSKKAGRASSETVQPQRVVSDAEAKAPSTRAAEAPPGDADRHGRAEPATPETKKPGKARRPSDPLTQLIDALEAHPKRSGLVKAGRAKDQLLRSLIPLYLAQHLSVSVSSGTTSRFWAKQGVKYAAPNAAKALREHEGYARRTPTGPRITAAGVKYVEAAVAEQSAT